MSITLTKNTVTKIRPEQHVIFREIIDKTNDPDYIHFHNCLINFDDEPFDPVSIYLRKWSLSRGYTRTDYDNEDNIDATTFFDISCNADMKLIYPDAVLNRLTKITGYDYLRDGCYTLMYVIYNDDGYYVPMHWTLDLPQEDRGDNCYDLHMSFEEHYAKHKDDIDPEYTCSIGISLTSAIMQISDIDVIADNEYL